MGISAEMRSKANFREAAVEHDQNVSAPPLADQAVFSDREWRSSHGVVLSSVARGV